MEIIRFPRHLFGASLEDTRIASDAADAQRLYDLGYQEVEDFLKAKDEAVTAKPKPKTKA